MTQRGLSQPGQFCFDFAQPRSPPSGRKHDPTDNLYLAPKPAPDDATRIADAATEWRSWLGTGQSSGCLHISLISLGRHDVLPDALIDKVHRLMSSFRGAPVDIAFDLLARFNGNALVLYGSTERHAFHAVRQTLMARMIAIPSVRKHNPNTVEPHIPSSMTSAQCQRRR